MEVNINRHESNGQGKFECGFCHRRWETPEQRMICEHECFEKEKEIERQHKIEEDREKEKEHQKLAKADEERIQREYEQLTKDIKHHVNTYGERVSIDTNKVGSIDSPFYIHVHDPFWEFNNMF